MRTEELSDFLYKVHYEDLPVKAVDQAKLYIEDLLGVALAGSTRQQGEIWRSYFAGDAGRPEAAAWNTGMERPCGTSGPGVCTGGTGPLSGHPSGRCGGF